jgi:hypothetical protein
MTEATAHEQLMLELVNAERAKAGVQPLAFNGSLNNSADSHSDWMIAVDAFSHTGVNGSSPTDRMKGAGYDFSGSWASAENIAWASTRAPSGFQDEVELLHANLMNSPGHRTNILNGSFREIGIGFSTGTYQGWEGAFVTENFAVSGTRVFLTGVASHDRDADRAYDINEGIGGLTVTATNKAGASYTTTTQAAGGYSLALPAGTYSVTFSGGGINSVVKEVAIGGSNVKLDLANPGSSPATPPAAISEIRGTHGNDTLKGTAGADVLNGFGGDDALEGGAGRDTAAFATAMSAVKVQQGTGILLTSGPEGNDTLTEVERLGFADGTLAFDVSGGAGQMYRLYQAAFARDPDAEGLGYWIREYDQGGKGLAGVAFDFMRSDEFKARYGSPDAVSDEAFLNLLYQNVLGRGPDAGGRAYWMDELADGFPRENLLASFSESLENQNLVAAEVQNGIWFI